MCVGLPRQQHVWCCTVDKLKPDHTGWLRTALATLCSVELLLLLCLCCVQQCSTVAFLLLELQNQQAQIPCRQEHI